MSIEAMKQALEALDSDNPDIQLRAATALRTAIEQAEKPVECMCGICKLGKRDWSLLEATQESLREHMAEIKRLKQRQWVGLTEIEICDIEVDELTSASSENFSFAFARAIEAKLKEKNSG